PELGGAAQRARRLGGIAFPVELGHPHAAEADRRDHKALAAQRPSVLDPRGRHRSPAREVSRAPRLRSPNWTTSLPTVSSWNRFFASDCPSPSGVRVTVAPSGVGQPRSAWTIPRIEVRVETVACQPEPVAMQPTALPER